jgi:hypothetical protein
MSQAKTDDPTVPVGDDNHPPKRTHRVPSARKIVVAKYVFYYFWFDSDTVF